MEDLKLFTLHCTLVKNAYERGDTTVNIYDTATGEKLKYEKLGQENLRPSYMNVFNDRVVFMDGWNKSVYMIDSI